MEVVENGGPGLESHSPQAKQSRVDGNRRKGLAQRKPLGDVNENAHGRQLSNKGEKFTVFCDAEEDVGEKLAEKKQEKPGLRIRNSASTSSHPQSLPQTQSSGYESLPPSTDVDPTHELLLAVSGNLMEAALEPRIGGDRLFDDSGTGTGQADDTAYSCDMTLDYSARSDQDEDAGSVSSSQYLSVVSEPASSTYYTAPLATNKELHRELITCCPVYAEEIFSYLIKRERDPLLRVSRNYMAKQTDITEAMRRTLVDWMVDVAGEYSLDQQTLHLSVRFVDRFLSAMDVPRAKLQLVGTTAIMIAAKLEEIYPPELKEFVYITDDTYTDVQVKRMERLMLEVLKWQLNCPTIVLFLTRFVQSAKLSPRTISLANYVVDLSLLKLDMAASRPSLLAAGAIHLAALITEESEPWPEELERMSGYRADRELASVCQAYLHLLHWATDVKESAIQDKYASSRYHSVARMEVPAMDALEFHYHAQHS